MHSPNHTTKEKPMYWLYKRQKVKADYGYSLQKDARLVDIKCYVKLQALQNDSIDINGLNVQMDTSSSSEDTVVPINWNRDCANKVEVDNGLNEARAHWIQLYKVNVQNQIVQQTFIYMISNHPQTRPIWHFSRKLNMDDSDWHIELGRNIQFRHHCSSIQTALTMIMDNLDDNNQLKKLLKEIGCHHFFYDTYEPHLNLMHESFMEAMQNTLKNSNEQLDAALCKAWNQFWDIIKSNMCLGIKNQRHIYLMQSITPVEMEDLRAIWKEVRKYGLDVCENTVTLVAFKTYNELLDQYKINLSLSLDEKVFSKFSGELMKALDITIDYYTTDKGFGDLSHVLKNIVKNSAVLDVCPSLVRKAFVDGLVTMLTNVIGDNSMNENTTHIWSKIYRVLEQAILKNILND